MPDADLSTSVDCTHSTIRFKMGVPSTSTRQVILVGTAESAGARLNEIIFR